MVLCTGCIFGKNRIDYFLYFLITCLKGNVVYWTRYSTNGWALENITYSFIT